MVKFIYPHDCIMYGSLSQRGCSMFYACHLCESEMRQERLQYLVISMTITLPCHFYDYDYYTARPFQWLFHCLVISMTISLTSHFYDYYTARPFEWLLHFLVISMTITMPGHFYDYYTKDSFFVFRICFFLQSCFIILNHFFCQKSILRVPYL